MSKIDVLYINTSIPKQLQDAGFRSSQKGEVKWNG